jgi:hypothetical protein
MGDYLAAAMNMPSMKRRLMAMAKPSINMANISGSDLARLHVPVPPIAAQQRYDAMRQRVQLFRHGCKEAWVRGNELFDSLVAHMFSARHAPPQGAPFTRRAIGS